MRANLTDPQGHTATAVDLTGDIISRVSPGQLGYSVAGSSPCSNNNSTHRTVRCCTVHSSHALLTEGGAAACCFVSVCVCSPTSRLKMRV